MPTAFSELIDILQELEDRTGEWLEPAAQVVAKTIAEGGRVASVGNSAADAFESNLLEMGADILEMQEQSTPGDCLVMWVAAPKNVGATEMIAEARESGLRTLVIANEEGFLKSSPDVCVMIPSMEFHRVREAQLVTAYVLARRISELLQMPRLH